MKMLAVSSLTGILRLSLSGLAAIAIMGSLSAHPTLAQFSAPPGQGSPKTTAGAGSRPVQPACLPKTQPLTTQPQATQLPSSQTLIAMAPTQFMGSTSQVSPTLWVFVPSTTAKTLEFSLFTQDQMGIYQTHLPIQTSGFVKVSLPAQIQLKQGQPYYWSAALICNPKRRTHDWVTGGWIQHRSLPLNLQKQLPGQLAAEQARFYARSDFWYDALNSFLELRQKQPQNQHDATLWADLLQPAGLPAIAPPKSFQFSPIASPAATWLNPADGKLTSP
jgi:Domain of Unknown Function (DUF928)